MGCVGFIKYFSAFRAQTDQFASGTSARRTRTTLNAMTETAAAAKDVKRKIDRKSDAAPAVLQVNLTLKLLREL